MTESSEYNRRGYHREKGGLVTVEQAITLLRNHNVVAIPTETVYGLAARADSAIAVRAIFNRKQRPADNPLIVHVDSLHMAEQIGLFDPVSMHLAEIFWPGPLTIVVPLVASLPGEVTAGQDTVAIRCPKHEVALEIISGVGCPLVAPSANRSGSPSPTSALHVLSDYNGMVPTVDGGTCEEGLESTIVHVTANAVVVLRPGAITLELIQQHCKLEVMYAGSLEGGRIRVPGTRYRHYAPRARVVLCYSTEELLKHQQEAVHHRTLVPPGSSVNGVVLTPQNLYAELRDADDAGVAEILVLCTDSIRANTALMDRLERASGKLGREIAGQ